MLAPVVLFDWPFGISAVQAGALVYLTVVAILVVNALLNATLDVYDDYAVARRFPIRTLVQAIKLIVAILGVVLVLSLLVGRSPLYFFSGLGAFTAVLLIVFRDAILGFVAGIPSLPLNHVLLRNRQVTGVEWGSWAGRHRAENEALLRDVMAMVASGELRPVEPTEYPLERTVDALRDLAERRASGKLVVVP